MMISDPQKEYAIRAYAGDKPKYHKGKYGKQYDSYTCGHCIHWELDFGPSMIGHCNVDGKRRSHGNKCYACIYNNRKVHKDVKEVTYETFNS